MQLSRWYGYNNSSNNNSSNSKVSAEANVLLQSMSLGLSDESGAVREVCAAAIEELAVCAVSTATASANGTHSKTHQRCGLSKAVAINCHCEVDNVCVCVCVCLIVVVFCLRQVLLQWMRLFLVLLHLLFILTSVSDWVLLLCLGDYKMCCSGNCDRMCV